MNGPDYWAILEAAIERQNPISALQFERLTAAVDPQRAARVLDIGCGRGDWLITWAQRFAIRGRGLELNPAFADLAVERSRAAGLTELLSWTVGPAADAVLAADAYDIGLCIGAAFALGGLQPTLDVLLRAVHRNGTLVIGDVYRRGAATAELAAEYGDLPDLARLVAAVERRGARVTSFVTATQDEWDHYQSQHLLAAERWLAAHPGHRWAAALESRLRRSLQQYLAWERDQIGFAVLVATRRVPVVEPLPAPTA